jgi:hypothetical protein
VPSANATVSFKHQYNPANQRTAMTNADNSRWVYYFCTLCVAAVISGCSGPARLADRPSDWFTTKSLVDDFIDSDETNIIARDAIFEVPSSNNLVAVNLLKNTPCIEMAKSNAEMLLGREIAVPKSLKVFLVRGLCQNRETGGFDCRYYRRKLSVAYGAMGSKSLPLEKQPIIVLLPDKPRKIFVTSFVME